jgi:hypothetical protein
MTIEVLYDIITNAEWYTGNSLQLPAGAVDKDGPVYSLLNTWVGSTLDISAIPEPPKKNGTTITLSGHMSLLNAGNVYVPTIVFSIIDDKAALFIDFPLPPSWTFATSFPALAGTGITQLNFQQAHFLLSSYEQPAAGSYPAMSAGLNFYAPSLQTNTGLLEVVTAVLGVGQTVAMSGPLSILSGSIQNLAQLKPGMTLSTAAHNISPASFLTLPVSLQCKAFLQKPGNDFTVAVLLSSQVTIGSKPPIGISVDITDPGKLLVFEADTALLVQHSLQDLAGFLNKAPVGEELGKYIKDFSNIITLKGIRIYINTKEINKSLAKAFSAIAVDIGSTSEWNVLPGYFKLESFDATFMVDDIISGPQITTTVTGTVGLIDQINLLLSASFPDVSFDAQLQEGSTINLTQLFSKFYPPASGFPVLICNQLDVNGTPGESNYGLSAGFTGDWQINAGVREIRLNEAVLSLNYDKNGNPATTGSIVATVDFIGNGDNSIAEFSVNWDIRKSFQLQGDFPDINLSELAKKIVNVANLSLPAGFPQLNLKNSKVTFTVLKPSGGNNPTGTVYDFSLTSTVQINSTDLGLVFEIQKNGQGWGCVAGIWTKNWEWSPAKQWPDVFGTILKDISFSKSGLIVSSLNNPSVKLENPPSPIPTSIGVGLTFFTSIDFGGSALNTLKKFFPDASGISLYAYLASPLSNSQFIAKIGQSSSTEKYSFDGLQFIISPATKSFSLQTGVTFSFTEIAGPRKGQPVVLDFIGGGTLSLEGAFDLYFVLKAAEEAQQVIQVKQLQRYTHNKLMQHKGVLQIGAPPPNSPGWKDPLGLEGITIENFWGEVGVSIEGALKFGFGGHVWIGDSNPVELEMDVVAGIEVEVPVLYVFIFKLIEEDKSKSIMLTSLIKQFTNLDLSWVPVLNGIGFKEFQLYIVLDPAGWRNPATSTQYQMGFYASGDVTFYGFEAVFDIAVYYSSGIKAWGYINKPLSLADGLFKLSDASGTKGPYGLIDTTAITAPTDKPYLFLSASMTLLAYSDTVCAYIKNNAFYLQMTLHQFIFTEKVLCSLSYSGGSFSFIGSVGGSIGLHLHTSKVELDGFEIIPPVDIDIELDMSITISINPGFGFHVTGSFGWGSLTLTVDFKLPEIKSWDDLKRLLTDYLEKYASQLFRDLVNDVYKWIDAMSQGLFTAAADVAKLLREAYKVAADVAAKLLSALGWTVKQIEDALVSFWNKTKQEAEKIVSEILKYCAIDQAYGLFSRPTAFTMRPDAEMLQSLAMAPGAQDMLYHYYLHQREIAAICTYDNEVRSRLRRMLNDHIGQNGARLPVVEDIITLLQAFRKKGTPELSDGLQPLLTLLRPYRKYHYDAFMTALNEQPAPKEDYKCPE